MSLQFTKAGAIVSFSEVYALRLQVYMNSDAFAESPRSLGVVSA